RRQARCLRDIAFCPILRVVAHHAAALLKRAKNRLDRRRATVTMNLPALAIDAADYEFFSRGFRRGLPAPKQHTSLGRLRQVLRCRRREASRQVLRGLATI